MQPQEIAGVTKSAYERMIEFSVLGAILAVVLISSIALVVWVIKTYNKKDEERDKYMRLIIERRAETAEKSAATQAITNERMSRLITMINTLVERDRGHGGREEDRE